MIEVTIKISDDECTLTEKFPPVHLQDSPISLTHEDVTIKKMVESAKSKFKGVATDILIKIKFTY